MVKTLFWYIDTNLIISNILGEIVSGNSVLTYKLF